MTYLNNQSTLIAQAEKLVKENPHLSEDELFSMMYSLYIKNYQLEQLNSSAQEKVISSYNDNTHLSNDKGNGKGLKIAKSMWMNYLTS